MKGVLQLKQIVRATSKLLETFVKNPKRIFTKENLIAKTTELNKLSFWLLEINAKNEEEAVL